MKLTEGYRIRNILTDLWWNSSLGWVDFDLADTYTLPMPSFLPTPGNSVRVPFSNPVQQPNWN